MPDPSTASTPAPPPPRVPSIDALRGLVIFAMIFVNDIAGAEHLPAWLKHYNDGRAGSGMTFVDLVFPAFLFIVGMSIPFAFAARLARGRSAWRLLPHVLLRTVSLLAIGILMVNTESGPPKHASPLSRTAWAALLYVAAILSFCTIGGQSSDPAKRRRLAIITAALRVLGVATLCWLALVYRSDHGKRLLTFHSAWPVVSVRTEWYGILGLIGWSYLVGALVYLLFRQNRLALLACMTLLLCLFGANLAGAFKHLWLARIVSIGEALGSHPSITVAGVLLATILQTPDTTTHRQRLRFAALFALACAAAALLLEPVYGISKNDATPAWCLWACAVTAILWLLFYLVTDVLHLPATVKPFTIAGQNVLLAYLLSEGLDSWLSLMHLGDWYGDLAQANLTHAVIRSAACAVIVLTATALLNRLGFKLKL